MDVGSAENARSNFQPTATDGGSAENVWSNFLPTHPWAFVTPPSMAPCDIPSIHGHKKGHCFLQWPFKIFYLLMLVINRQRPARAFPVKTYNHGANRELANLIYHASIVI
jgi:hypothetical protein